MYIYYYIITVAQKRGKKGISITRSRRWPISHIIIYYYNPLAGAQVRVRTDFTRIKTIKTRQMHCHIIASAVLWYWHRFKRRRVFAASVALRSIIEILILSITFFANVFGSGWTQWISAILLYFYIETAKHNIYVAVTYVYTFYIFLYDNDNNKNNIICRTIIIIIVYHYI